MLTLLPQPQATTLDEARALLLVVESWRPALWMLELVLLPLLGVGLMVGGVEAGAFLIGSALALALCRYGPRRWPGRR